MATQTLITASKSATASVGLISDQWLNASLSLVTTSGTARARVRIFAQAETNKEVFNDTMYLNGSTLTPSLGNVYGTLQIIVDFLDGTTGTLAVSINYTPGGTGEDNPTASLATILSTLQAPSVVAQPSDYTDGRLVMNLAGTKWLGFLGTFANFAALDAISKTNIGGGMRAKVPGGEYFFNQTTGAWVYQLLTDPTTGVITAGGAVVAPNLSRFAATTMRESSRSSRPRMIIEGSSSAQQGSTTQTIYGGTAAVADAFAGPITQARMGGLPVDLVFNGAVGDYNATQIKAHLLADWPSVAGLCDWVYLQIGASELASRSADIPALRSIISTSVAYIVSGGKRCALDIPHAVNPSPVHHSVYADHIAWCRALAASYPIGSVVLVDRYSVLCAGGVDTPLSLMAQDTTPAVHLNCAGAVAARPAYNELAAMLGGWLNSRDPYALGQPVALLTGANASISASSCTIVPAASTPEGRPRHTITAITGPLGCISLAVTGLDTSAEYFLAGSWDVVTPVAGAQYVDGAKFVPASGNQIRMGIYSVEAGGIVASSVRAACQNLGTGLRFKPGAANGSILFYPGDLGGVCTLNWIGLFKAPA